MFKTKIKYPHFLIVSIIFSILFFLIFDLINVTKYKATMWVVFSNNDNVVYLDSNEQENKNKMQKLQPVYTIDLVENYLKHISFAKVLQSNYFENKTAIDIYNSISVVGIDGSSFRIDFTNSDNKFLSDIMSSVEVEINNFVQLLGTENFITINIINMGEKYITEDHSIKNIYLVLTFLFFGALQVIGYHFSLFVINKKSKS